MLEIRKPIPIGEAVNRIMKFAVKGSTEFVSINESYGRYLSEELVATNHVPPFDKSPYDGFAVRSIDTKNATFRQSS